MARNIEHQEFPKSWGVLDATYNRRTGTLLVEVYNHGNHETLEYRNVPEEVYEGLKAAPSKGSFFNREIRNSYEFAGKR